MSKIVIIGAGAMGSAFALPCLDNNHDTNIIGTHLEDEFINSLKKNKNLHPSLGINIPEGIKIFKFDEFNDLFKSSVDLIVLGISSKGIEWVSEQLSSIAKDKKLPNILMLTKGLSIHENRYELLVDKLKRLFTSKGITKVNISAVGGPCLAAGLANRIHSSVVIANEEIKTAKEIANMVNTTYYHTSYSDDLKGVEVSAAIKNIFSMAVGAAKGLCSKNASKEIREKNYLNTASALIKQSVYKMGSYIGEGLTFSEAKKTKMEKITVEGADLAKEIGKKVNEDFDEKKLPLMLAMINAIVDNKKLEFNWEAFR